ncbi:MAG: HAMP domain-containing histidine kinase [Sediminibacterium sp.]|nr:HAMP domain-containing histidine kinase [Sediminibacterium sp.]
MRFSISKLVWVRIIYWLFLTYMVAAFIWWYVALVKQNELLTATKIETLVASGKVDQQHIANIEAFAARKTKQYIGEGLTFLMLFLLGAIYVYRSLLKQLKYSTLQQNFMMAVTHELKTPIAVTQLNLETIIKRDLKPEQQQHLIQNTLKETKRLDALCNNILLASQLDMGQYETNKQIVDLSVIAVNCVQSFEERYANRQCIASIEPNIHMQGEPLLLQLMINNLLDNANKYAEAGTPIMIQLRHSDAGIEFEVKDQGVGIALEERTKVFDKFYRVGAEQTRTTKGTGLGLYLCKKIVTFHGGQIVIKSNQPKGSIFVVQFKVD